MSTFCFSEYSKQKYISLVTKSFSDFSARTSKKIRLQGQIFVLWLAQTPILTPNSLWSWDSRCFDSKASSRRSHISMEFCQYETNFLKFADLGDEGFKFCFFLFERGLTQWTSLSNVDPIQRVPKARVIQMGGSAVVNRVHRCSSYSSISKLCWFQKLS